MAPRYRFLLAVGLFTLHFPRAAPGQTAEEIHAGYERLTRLQAQRPEKVPPGALVSIAHYLEVAQRYHGRGAEAANATRYYGQAIAMLDDAEASRDPFAARKGFVVRAYESPLTKALQPYSVYVPENYDPQQAKPLLVVLHGGSSNHSLFLGVVFGNNVPWADYRKHLRTLYHPRYTTDWLVVAPNGFGQVMWRWMGEQDVLDVIDDVQKHYNVDGNRIVLNGISNGGVGTYSIGARHAWRFAGVIPMAGAPSWRQYLRLRLSDLENRLVSPFGAWDSVDNLRNTGLFRFHHGRTDTGPMRPRFVADFRDHITKAGVPFRYVEHDLGHDIMYAVHRRMKMLSKLGDLRRPAQPAKVWVTAWDYRARRQHWLEVEHFVDFAQPARLVGEVQQEGARLVVSTENTDAVTVHLEHCPYKRDGPLEVVFDDQLVVALHPDHHEKLRLHRHDGSWRLGPWPKAGRKRPGLSGPLTDVLHTCQHHVYGTAVEEDTKILRRAAEKAARGNWVQWAWDFTHPVVSDREINMEKMSRCSTVLYGDRRSNRILARIADRLPIKVMDEGIKVGPKLIPGNSLGARWVMPNPLAPEQYLVVQTGMTARAVAAGNNLPDFLPDYVVYDKRTVSSRPRGVFHPSRRPPAAGFFNDRWKVPY